MSDDEKAKHNARNAIANEMLIAMTRERKKPAAKPTVKPKPAPIKTGPLPAEVMRRAPTARPATASEAADRLKALDARLNAKRAP